MATSIIKLHTLSGAGDNGTPCYLLQIDEFHCLLDCGWCEKLDSAYVREVSKWAKHIDAVLLSHQSLRHLGLLPYLVGTCGLNCPVYATTPVYKMGQMFLYDFYQSRHATEDFSHFTLDDVDLAFDHVHQVKYQQTISLHGRGHGVCITPLPSGHTLGGTIWKLVKEDTSVVYALDFNHKKERHLNGATFDACIRPHLLIMDGSNTLYTQPRRKDRDENLRQSILKSLRRGGNVLIAVDTAGRCLEIAHFLEQCWLNQESGLMAYGLAMLNYVALNVVDFAKSMVEWMSEKVMRSFEDQRSNPFHFRHMQLCHTLEQLDAVSEPKVVLSSLSDLSCGFSRQLFAEWADNDLNTIILTSRDSITSGSGESSVQSLISRLIGLARKDLDARKDLPTSSTGTLILPLTLSQRVSCSQAERSRPDISHLRNSAKVSSIIQSTESTTGDIPDELTSETESANANVSFTDIPMPSTNDVTHEDVSPHGTEGALEKRISHGSEMETESAPNENRPCGSEEASYSDKSKAAPLTLSLERDRSQKTISSSVAKLLPQACIQSVAMNADYIGGTNIHLTSGRHQAGYDIYPGLHNQAGGQFFRVAKRTQLLFPQNEKKIHWDEYGAHLDPELFPSTEPVSSQVTLPNWDVKNKDTKIITDIITSSFTSSSILDYLVAKTPHLDVLDSNTRCVAHNLEIPLRCEIIFLDYEGRSDGEAMKRILIGLRPQEVILVGNNSLAVDHLANYCRGVMLLDQSLIHIPHAQEVVNCTKEGDIYQARMKDSLVSSLKFTKIRDYELAWVEATVSLDDKSDYHIQEKLLEDDVEMSNGNHLELESKSRTPLAADELPVLGLPNGPVGHHETVFVNEPKLSDLKQLLLSQGLMAEFVSGILVVDNCVAIKRSEAGKLLLEGLLCGTYFETSMSISKYTFDSVMDDVQLLISRMRAREEVADALRQQASKLQSQLLSMRQCREETLGFEEFSKCALTHPKGQLLVCLAAENKQLEQLRIENKTLRNSLDEHNTALDMIMSKYRGQISKLMRTSEVEQIFQSIMNPDSSQASHKKISKYDPSCPHSSVLAKQPTDSVVSQPVLRKPKSNTDSVDGSRKVEESGNGLVQSLTQQLNTVVSVVREVTDQGDVYAAELEEELHRLRSENAGLRELLMISSDCCPDTNLGNSTLLPPVSLPKKVSIQDESSLPEPPGRFIFLREDPSSIRSSRMDESLNSLEVNGNSLFYDAPSDNGGDAGVCNIDSDNHSNVDSGDEDVTVYGSSDESQAS